MLNTKDLAFKEKPVNKVDKDIYIGPYIVEEVVLRNVVKLKLPDSMRIHPVVNISRIVKYKEPITKFIQLVSP